MNNIEQLEQNIKKFNKFLKEIGLTHKGKPLVEADKILNYDNCMSGSLLVSKEKIKAILSDKLCQQPRIRFEKTYTIASFEFFDFGWIIIEDFGDDMQENAFITLQNKWW